MAGPKGFEPSVFSVTGRRVNRATPRTHILRNGIVDDLLIPFKSSFLVIPDLIRNPEKITFGFTFLDSGQPPSRLPE